MLTITLLGTAATMPLPERALTAAVAECGGHSLLLDCGEGTQTAARRAGVNLMRADAICLTHYHGDHIFGLPGLLQTLGAQGRTRPLVLLGPEGLLEVWRAVYALTGPLPYAVKPLVCRAGQPVALDALSDGWPAGATLLPVATKHRVRSLGYRLDLPRAGRFDPEKARALGVPVTQWRLLQRGQAVPLAERMVQPAEVAFALDMPYQVLDFTADFRAQIIEKFIRVYEAGGTPNPCIDCNKYMKFRHLLDWAEEHGMEYVVTGHYARVEQDAATGRWLLKKGLDEGKDQSYVLYNLTQEQLAHIRLPLGALHKTEVREIAQEHSFINAQKHDSQDICFVPDGDYARFMEQFTGKHYPAGDFLDRSGKVVGTHSGAVRYTLGQRKGLGLALGAPVYVCGKDMQANTVTVGPESELFDSIVYAEDVNWIAIPALTGPLRVTARTRYHQAEQQATVYPAENGFRLEFDQPQRAPTPGQAAVLYQGDVVLGGGTITRVEK